jgi:competence protein ComEA
MNRHLKILASALALSVMSCTFAHTTHHKKTQKPAIVVIKKIDINTASAAQLITLPHIGIKKAQAIVAYRQSHHRFKSVDELTAIRGISQKILAKIKPYAMLTS